MAESDLLYSELTRDIIGAAMEVHKILGAGFAESVYEESLSIEFDLRKIPYERQKPIDIVYKGRFAKQFVCDFMVYDKIIVELKAIKAISDIETAQVLNYLKGTDLNLGLLLNFGASSLEYKRLINTIPRNP
ncbi:MAG: GxxExxY protein [Sedimentisphaerales bacterium]|nr:GxxExxY protein [Sedimentisphaerales bacterium]